jgi:NDP-sugar pyrophosphorylase family protein
MPELLRAMTAAAASVRVFETQARWLDMGSMADLELANEALSDNPAQVLP